VSHDWRNDAATDIEKAKLSFFGCTWDDGITRGQASDAIKQCVRMFPDRDMDYQKLPAGEEHLAILRSLGVAPEETGDFLTIAQAERLISDVQTKRFTAEFMPIKGRIERSLVVTDDDFEAIEYLKKKYDIELTLEGNFAAFRSAFLIEVKHQLPEPISVDLMLDDCEMAYYSVPTTWHQVFTRGGFADTKAVAQGVLYVTSERLVFCGFSRNASVSLKKILSCRYYSDFLKVDKTTGRSDLFSMTVAEARYVGALIRALKQQSKAPEVVERWGQSDADVGRVRQEDLCDFRRRLVSLLASKYGLHLHGPGGFEPATESLYDSRRRVMSLLREKYGLHLHDQAESEIQSLDINTPQYVTCRCQHCDGGIEFDAGGFQAGIRVQCPHCGLQTEIFIPAGSQLTPVARGLTGRRKMCSNLSKLTEETIRKRTKAGDTPLHRAAKEGRIREIPPHLLKIELFMVKNGAGDTPLHIAAKQGHLDQVPRQFLTKDTLTISTSPHYAPASVYTTGSGYKARTVTALHIAVSSGHAEQIPKEFMTPEFLSIPATGYRWTVLHYLAMRNQLDLVPDNYAHSEMWSLKNHDGLTPREVLESKIASDAYIAGVRDEPATEKQKEKLRWFGSTWDDGITKGQASDAIDECVKRFPEKDLEYYNRPATEEQREQLKSYGKDPDKCRGKPRRQPLTYGEAKEWIRECFLSRRARNERKFFGP
jgi:ankyrin repeat protein